MVKFKKGITAGLAVLFVLVAATPAYAGKWITNYTNASFLVTNFSVGGNKYALISLPNAKLLWNYTSKDYVNDSNAAYYVLLQHFSNVSNSYISAYKNSLINSMKLYTSTFTPSFKECYTILGLTSGLPCTVGDRCLACTTVPSCNAYINPMPNIPGSGTGGMIFIYWAANFAYQAKVQNASLNAFNAAVSALNYSNFDSKISIINSALKNLSLVARNMTINGILNASPSRYDTFGYCKPIAYNTTLLAAMQQAASNLKSYVIPSSFVQSIAANVSKSYAAVVVAQEYNKAYKEYYNSFSTINRDYYYAVKNATYALGLYKADFLQKAYNALVMNYSYYNRTISNVTEAHSKLRALIEKVENYSAMVISLSAQINQTSKSMEGKVTAASIDFNDENVTARYKSILASLNGATYENAAVAYSQLLNISQSIDYRYSNDLNIFVLGVIKSAFAPFGRAISSNIFFMNTLGFAAYLIVLLILGGLVYLILPIELRNLRKKGKVKITNRTKKNWIMIFVVWFIFVASAVSLAAIYGYQLISKAPVALALKSMGAKPSIFVNSTDAVQCANALGERLNSTPMWINFTKGICYNLKNQSLTLGIEKCLSTDSAIFLSYANHSSVTAAALSSSYIVARGNSTAFQDCSIIKGIEELIPYKK